MLSQVGEGQQKPCVPDWIHFGMIYVEEPKVDKIRGWRWRARKAGSNRDGEVCLEGDSSGSAETQQHMSRTVATSAGLHAMRAIMLP